MNAKLRIHSHLAGCRKKDFCWPVSIIVSPIKMDVSNPSLNVPISKLINHAKIRPLILWNCDTDELLKIYVAVIGWHIVHN